MCAYDTNASVIVICFWRFYYTSGDMLLLDHLDACLFDE